MPTCHFSHYPWLHFTHDLYIHDLYTPCWCRTSTTATVPTENGDRTNSKRLLPFSCKKMPGLTVRTHPSKFKLVSFLIDWKWYPFYRVTLPIPRPPDLFVSLLFMWNKGEVIVGLVGPMMVMIAAHRVAAWSWHFSGKLMVVREALRQRYCCLKS